MSPRCYGSPSTSLGGQGGTCHSHSSRSTGSVGICQEMRTVPHAFLSWPDRLIPGSRSYPCLTSLLFTAHMTQPPPLQREEAPGAENAIGKMKEEREQREDEHRAGWREDSCETEMQGETH